MTNTTGMTLDPLPPIAAPDEVDLATLADLITKLYAQSNGGGRPALKAEIVRLYDKLLNQITALPDTHPLSISIDGHNGIVLTRYITIMQKVGAERRDSDLKFKFGKLDCMHLAAELTNTAAGYRQALARHKLFETITLARSQGDDLSAYKRVASASNPDEYRLFHPAEMIVDHQLMSRDFIKAYIPNVFSGQPQRPWTQGIARATHMSLIISCPK